MARDRKSGGRGGKTNTTDVGKREHGLQANRTPARKTARTGHVRGGNIIGHGRNKNVVFTVDELPSVFPGTFRACFRSETESCPPLCLEKRDIDNIQTYDHVSSSDLITDLEATVALKYVTSPYDQASEIRNNTMIRMLFSELGLMSLTSLHPDYDVCEVYAFPPEPVSDGKIMLSNSSSKDKLTVHVTVVYRRMVGSIDMLYDRKMTQRGVFEVAQQVLSFLCVIHANGYMHMDIKPENVLFDLVDGRVKTVLSDYGELTPMTYLHSSLRIHGQYVVGTFGFMSPLLTDCDDENNVYGVFEKLSHCADKKGENGAGNVDADVVSEVERHDRWAEYFDHNRSRMVVPSDVAKVDLHSLGFVLLNLMTDPGTALNDPSSLMGTFLRRLMLFRKGDFFSASDALRFMCKQHREMGCDTREATKALRAQPVAKCII